MPAPKRPETFAPDLLDALAGALRAAGYFMFGLAIVLGLAAGAVAWYGPPKADCPAPKTQERLI